MLNNKEITPHELREKLNNDHIKLIDVRTPEEYEKGHLKGAKLININDSYFASELEELDKQQEYVVYCGSGNKGDSARNLMERKGFEVVRNLKGGLEAWQEEGNEVIS